MKMSRVAVAGLLSAATALVSPAPAYAVTCEVRPGVFVCATAGEVVLDQVVPSATVPPGAEHRVVGYLDAYDFVIQGTGTHTLPCVVLSSDLTGDVDPCAEAGGTFSERRLVLLEEEPREPDPQLAGAVARVRVCRATYRVTVFGFGAQALPGAVLC